MARYSVWVTWLVALQVCTAAARQQSNLLVDTAASWQTSCDDTSCKISNDLSLVGAAIDVNICCRHATMSMHTPACSSVHRSEQERSTCIHGACVGMATALTTQLMLCACIMQRCAGIKKKLDDISEREVSSARDRDQITVKGGTTIREVEDDAADTLGKSTLLVYTRWHRQGSDMLRHPYLTHSSMAVFPRSCSSAEVGHCHAQVRRFQQGSAA